MNCPKCGSPLPDNSQFCGMCGAQLNQSVQPNQPPKQQPNTSPQVHIPAQYRRQQQAPQAQQAPQPQPQPQQQYQPQPQQVPQQQYQQPQQQYYNNQQQYYNQPAYAGAAAAQPQKKKGKGGLVVCIVLAVIAALVLIGFACKTAITKSVLGEFGSYAVAELNTMSTILDNDEFEALLDTDEFSFDANGTIAFDDSESTGKLAAKGAYSGEEDKATGKITLSSSESTDSIDYVFNMGNGKLGIELDGKTTIIPLQIDDLNTDELGDLVAKLYPIIKKAEKERLASGITTTKEVIDGKKYKVTVFTLKESDIDYALADILEAAQQDEEIMASVKKLLEDNATLINQFSEELNGMSANEIYTELTTSLPELIKTLRAEADALVASGDTKTMTYKVAYKNSKEILQRQFTSSETTFTLKTVVAGSTSTVTYIQDETTHVEYVVTNTNGKTMAQLTGTIANSSFSVTASDLETKSVNGVKVPVGTINFAVGDTDSGKITMTADDKFNVKVEYFNGKGKALDADLGITLNSEADLSDYKEPTEDANTTTEDFSSFFGM